MATQKIQVLKVGAGSLKDDSQTATIWANAYLPARSDLTGNTTSGSNIVDGISSTLGLVEGMAIEHVYLPIGTKIIDIIDSTSVKVSQNATNTLTAPLTIIAGKDGDIWFRVNGNFSEQFIRTNGVWMPVLGVPTALTVINLATTSVFIAKLSQNRFFTVEYSWQRGASFRSGKLRIASNGVDGPTGASLVESDINEIGTQSVLDWDAACSSSSNSVELSLTTDGDLSTPIGTLKYNIKGWN